MPGDDKRPTRLLLNLKERIASGYAKHFAKVSGVERPLAGSTPALSAGNVMRISIPLYRKVWWEGDFHHNGTVTMRLMAFNGKENIVLETHENIKVVWKEEDTEGR